jgi:hypothetical protein
VDRDFHQRLLFGENGYRKNANLISKLFYFYCDKKIPPSERSTVPPASQTGANFGIIFTTPLVSIMVGENFLGGWPSAFYVFGKINYKEIFNTKIVLFIIRCFILFVVYRLVFFWF